MIEIFRQKSVSVSCLLFFVLSLQLTSISADNPEFSAIGARVVHSSLAPIQGWYNRGLHFCRGVWERYIWLIGVEQERRRLQGQVKGLEAANAQLIEMEKENERLRGLLNFSEIHGLKGAAANVVGRDPSNWFRTITVDRGSRHGLSSGLAVLDGFGIVGQTTIVSAKNSKVLLLTDHLSSIDVVIQRTRHPGIVQGSIDGNLRLKYVLSESDVRLGDRVVSSGLGGVFPKGLLVGVVVKVENDGDAMFQEIMLEPSVRLDNLETVMVLDEQEVVSEPKAELSEEIIRQQ